MDKPRPIKDPQIPSDMDRIRDADPTVSENRPDGRGARIGRYKLLQQIGEGGFGVVFMAEQEEPVRRRVALKVIKLGMDTRQVIARFEAEQQALALMDHPNIARVLDAGATAEGRPFFVMELVRGTPLIEYCDTNKLTTRERLELFIQVCRAIQHAHQKGIIHRDIKPSNVLVTISDGKPIPKVIDFGIAKATDRRLTEKTLFTEYRQLIGTPQYMSPEQAELSGTDIDTRSDIYSLGVLLYELLTGTTPFTVGDVRSTPYDELRRMIREVDPPKPSTRISTLGQTLATVAAHRRIEPGKLGKLIRGDLDWIVMKAMEKDRTRRYETANALAMDVQRYLNDESISAGPPGAGYRLHKLVRRHRGLFAAIAVIIGALAIGMTAATLGFVRARIDRNRAVMAMASEAKQRQLAEQAQADAERQKLQAEAAQKDAERALAEMYPNNGFLASDAAQNAVAGLWFATAAQKAGPDTELARINIGRALAWNQRAPAPVAVLKLGSRTIRDVSISPDNQFLIVRSVEPGEDNASNCTIWDLANQKQLNPPAEWGRITFAAWPADGKTVALGRQSGDVQVCTFPSLEPLYTIEHSASGPVRMLAFSEDGKLLASAEGNYARVWDCVAQRFVTPGLKHAQAVTAVTFSPAADRLATACADGRARVFAVGSESGKLLFAVPHTGQDPTGESIAAAFTDAGRALITADGDQVVWHRATDGTEIRRAPAGGSIRALHARGRMVAVLAANRAKMFEGATGEEGGKVDPRSPVMFIDVSGDGRRLAAASDSVITLLTRDALDRSPTVPFVGSGGAKAARFSPDVRMLAVADGDGTVVVWSLPGPLPASFPLPNDGYSSANFSADGKFVVVSGLEVDDTPPPRPHEVQVFSVETGREAGPPIESGGAVSGTALVSRLGRVAVIFESGGGYVLGMWDWRDATRASEPIHLPSPPRSLSMASDESVLAVLCRDGEVLIMDPQDGRVRRQWKGRPNADYDFILTDGRTRFSHDGRDLLVWGSENIEMRAVDTGELRFPAIVFSSPCVAAWHSPDDRYFAANDRNVIRVFDAHTGAAVGGEMPHLQMVTELRFSPDGNQVATVCEDHMARVWDWRSGRQICEAIPDIRRARYVADGRLLVLHRTSDALDVVDPHTGRFCAPTIHGAGRLWGLDVSPTSGHVAIGAVAQPIEILSLAEFGPPANGEADDVIQQSELLSGQRLERTGIVKPLTPQQWQELWKKRSTPGRVTLVTAFQNGAGAWHRWMADAAQKTGDEEAADYHLKRLLASASARASDRLARARALAGEDRWPEAAAEFSIALDRSPTDRAARRQYADALIRIGEIAKAEAQLTRIINGGTSSDTRTSDDPLPNSGKDFIQTSWWVRGLSRGADQTNPLPEQAYDLGSVALETAPNSNDPRGWKRVGSGNALIDLNRLFSHTDYSTAHAQCRIFSLAAKQVLLTIIVDDAARLWLNGIEVGQVRTANRSIQMALKLQRGWNTLRLSVSNFQFNFNFRTVFSDDPLRWAEFLQTQHRRDELFKTLDQAVSVKPGDATILAARGWYRARAGRFAEGDKDLAAAMAINSSNALDWYRRGCVLAYMGDQERFHSHVAAMLDRYRDNSDRVLAARAAMTSLLLAPATQPSVLPVQSELAERALAGEPPAADLGHFHFSMGLLDYRAGKYQDALDWLQRARSELNGAPDPAAADLYRALAFKKLGQQDRAVETYRAAARAVQMDLERLGLGLLANDAEGWLIAQVAYREARSEFGPYDAFATRLEELTAILRKRPNSVGALQERGMLFVRVGRFKEAAADFEKLRDLEPDDIQHLYEDTCLYAWIGKPDEYRRMCAQMMRRAEASDKAQLCERTAKVCSVMPSCGIDPEDVCRIAERGMAMQSYGRLARGMAEYRAGRYRQAQRWLIEADAPEISGFLTAQAARWLFLAMAQLRGGQTTEAHESFARGMELLHNEIAPPDSTNIREPYNDWIIAQLACREATEVFQQPATRPTASAAGH